MRAGYTAIHGVVQECEILAGDLAMTLARSIYETTISAYWMSLQPTERADAFDRFAGLELATWRLQHSGNAPRARGPSAAARQRAPTRISSASS